MNLFGGGAYGVVRHVAVLAGLIVEEGGQRDDVVRIGIVEPASSSSPGRLPQHRFLQPQRFRKPAGIGKQAFRLLRHIAFLQVLDHLRRLFAAAFAHRLEYSRLRNPAEIILGGGFQPASAMSSWTAWARTSPCSSAPGRLL